LPIRSLPILEPRKSPIQARSTASVDAILEATIQVLLQVGKESLTTTKVALRAGVSVGTLYQYFPNKSALLQAALRRHMTAVTEAIELVSKQQKGAPLRQMITALINAFFAIKMKDVKTSVALYSVSSDVDGTRIVRQMSIRSNKTITHVLTTSSEQLATDPELVATMIQASMVGVSRRLLESPSPEKHLDVLLQELIFMACTYLDACSLRPPLERTHA
jgi:AcrR family transcriptional regulator